MRHILLLLVGILLCGGVSAQEKAKKKHLEYLSIGVSPLLTFPIFGKPYENTSQHVLNIILDEVDKGVGLGAGVVLDYRRDYFGLQLRFDNVFHFYDYAKHRAENINPFIKEEPKPQSNIEYVENPIVFHSMTLRISPRFYYGPLFIAPEIGFENSYATMRIDAHEKIADGSFLKDTYESHKQVGRDLGLFSYGFKIGIVGVTKKKRNIIELYLGWSNVHLHGAVAKLEREQYGLKPIRIGGRSSMLELGMVFSFPLIKIKD